MYKPEKRPFRISRSGSLWVKERKGLLCCFFTYSAFGLKPYANNACVKLAQLRSFVMKRGRKVVACVSTGTLLSVSNSCFISLSVCICVL